MIYIVEGVTWGKKDRNRVTSLVHIICMCIPTQLGRRYNDLIVGRLYVPQRKKNKLAFILSTYMFYFKEFFVSDI